MANLRGSSFDKQIKDAVHRIAKLGTSRHNKSVNGFVSINRLNQAKTMLNKFANYLRNEGITSGKLNEYLSNQAIVRNFAETHILNENYAPSTVQEYASLFAKTLENLAENNVSIHKEVIEYAKELYNEAKQNFNADSYDTGRYVSELNNKLDALYEKNFASAVIAEVQASLGFRISEAHELVKNFQDYYNPQTNTVEHIIGKGNHEYQPKEISYDLVQKIEALHQNHAHIPSQNAYREDLKDIGIPKSHDLRITYAKNLYDHLKDRGYTEREALKEVSKELNHHRIEVTRYYLARA